MESIRKVSKATQIHTKNRSKLSNEKMLQKNNETTCMHDLTMNGIEIHIFNDEGSLCLRRVVGSTDSDVQ